MRKSLKLFLALLFIGCFALSLSSCKDSENVSNIPTTPEEIAQSKHTEPAQALLSFLSFTSELDSLPDNWFSDSYTQEPTIGLVNDASTPHVRYIAVQDKDEAIAKYNSFASEKIATNATSASWSIEGMGNMTFQILNQPDVFATLDVNIKQQPHLTQIRFVPASALGDNASFSGKPYYNFGDVVSLQEGSNTSYWICVRPCSNIQGKKKSHWMSFNLNDWDSKDKKGVPEESVNFIKLSEDGYEDYYLPTQLGNCSGSLEHLQNLFLLLKVLVNPDYYDNPYYDKGIGGIGKDEFTKSKVSFVAGYWDAENIWKKVLPKHVGRIDFENLYRDLEDINAFYYGYHKFGGLGIYLAKVSTSFTDRSLLLSSGRLSWKRTKAQGVDFHDYANWGLQNAEVNLEELTALPQNGFIVRYKTGAQLVGKGSGNDEAPAESFTVKHPKSIANIYVLGDRLKKSGVGAAIMGDKIKNEGSHDNEICVLNNSEDAPSKWEDCSYFFRMQNSGDAVIMQTQDIAIQAYTHLLNALMLQNYQYDHVDINKLPKFSADYERGLKALLDGLYRDPMGERITVDGIVEFQAEDKNGNKVYDNDAQKITQYSLTMDFVNKGMSEGWYYRGKLTYNLSSGKYTFKNLNLTVKSPARDFLNLKAYKDAHMSEPAINKGAGQTFEKSITEDRDKVKQAVVDFTNKNSVK